jgi:predicted metal-binding membrane protein
MPHDIAGSDPAVAWRGHAVAGALVVAVAGLGWAVLVGMVAAVPADGRAALGPLMELFGGLGVPAELAAALAVICEPQSFGEPSSGAAVVGSLSMWFAMTAAMMLPAAVPTLYARAAATAARGGRGAGSARSLAAAAGDLMLLGGYLAVWAAFAVAGALVQSGLVALGALTPALAPAGAILAGTTLLAAGIYQFTPAKRICLDRCRRPVAAPGVERAGGTGLWRLGVADGLASLGCCAGLMAAMFALGLMNLAWMAILTVAMTVEKATDGDAVPSAIGAALVLWGGALVAASPAGRALVGF